MGVPPPATTTAIPLASTIAPLMNQSLPSVPALAPSISPPNVPATTIGMSFNPNQISTSENLQADMKSFNFGIRPPSMVMDPNLDNSAAARLNPNSYVPVQPFVMPQQVQLPPGETPLPYLHQETADNVLKHRHLSAEKEKSRKRFAAESVTGASHPVGLGLSGEVEDVSGSSTQNQHVSATSNTYTQESAPSTSKNNEQQDNEEEEEDDEEYVPPQDDNEEGDGFRDLGNGSSLTGFDFQNQQQRHQKQQEEDDALVDSFLNEDLF
jgi:hypothetical protein